MTTYDNIKLTNDSDVVLMYFPITSTVEEVWQNTVGPAALPWSSGGQVAFNDFMWASEIMIQGVFISSDAPAPADFVTALRTLSGMPAAPAVITARMQWNYLLSKLLTEDNFRLYYLDDEFKHTAPSDVIDGEYPPIIPVEARIIAEGSKDEIHFTLRFLMASNELG